MKKRQQMYGITALLLILILSISGCTLNSGVRIMGDNKSTASSFSGSYKLFAGEDSKFVTFKTNSMKFTYTSEVIKGTLSMKLVKDNTVLAEFATNTTGFQVVDVIPNERYQILVKGTKMEGNYEIHWENQD